MRNQEKKTPPNTWRGFKYRKLWREKVEEFKKLKARSRKWSLCYRIAVILVQFALRRFWTFTFYDSIPDSEKMSRWNSFITSLRYYYPGLKYLLIKERHKSGKIHLHCLFNVYVDWNVAQRLWEKAGCGKVCHVKFIYGDTRHVARYVSKYLSKDEGIKRPVTSSREFCIYLSNFWKWLKRLIDWQRWDQVEKILLKIDLEEVMLWVINPHKKKLIRRLQYMIRSYYYDFANTSSSC